MPLDPAYLYTLIGRHIEEAPDLTEWPLPSESQRWLGRAVMLVEQTNDIADHVQLRDSINRLSSAGRRVHAQNIMLTLYRALARAEINAPNSDQGAFISTGSAFDAMVAIGKVLQSSNTDILFVDPYMDERILSDFALLAPERVKIRLLADINDRKASLGPAVHRWIKQYAEIRPLEVRLAPHRALHDRIIFVDQSDAWVLTQSFNSFAERSPASISRSNSEIAEVKIAAYRAMWEGASPI